MVSLCIRCLLGDPTGRFGDYRQLVDGKLKTAAELYEFMVDQFHQSRAFVLELMVVVILIIDLIFLFRGRGL